MLSLGTEISMTCGNCIAIDGVLMLGTGWIRCSCNPCTNGEFILSWRQHFVVCSRSSLMHAMNGRQEPLLIVHRMSTVGLTADILLTNV